MNEPHSDDEIARLAKELTRHQIQFVFVYVSYWKPAGTFNPTFGYASSFTARLKAAQPTLNAQAWVGLPVRTRGVLGTSGSLNLDDPAARARGAAFSAQMVREAGFDGVHLDPEPVQDGNAGMPQLLNDVRAAIGPTATLSVATPRIRPLFAGSSLPAFGPPMWSASYHRRVASQVDQLAVMTYDTGLPLPGLYRLWQQRQVSQLSRALAGTRAKVFVGIPASEDWTWTHWPKAENVPSGITGVGDALAAAGGSSVVTGLAIYPDWEMNQEKWETYYRLWLGKFASSSPEQRR